MRAVGVLAACLRHGRGRRRRVAGGRATGRRDGTSPSAYASRSAASGGAARAGEPVQATGSRPWRRCAAGLLASRGAGAGRRRAAPRQPPARRSERRVDPRLLRREPAAGRRQGAGPRPEREDTLLRFLGGRAGAQRRAVELVARPTSASRSLLDVSQGTRQPTGPVRRRRRGRRRRARRAALRSARRAFVNWQPFRDARADVSRTIRPGLLAGSVPGGAGFVGARGAPLLPAIAAADERGHVAEVSFGAVATLAARARGCSRAQRLVVVVGAVRARGPRAAAALARGRAPDELLLVAQLPDTPQPGALLRPPLRAAAPAGVRGRRRATAAARRRARRGATASSPRSTSRRPSSTGSASTPPDRMRGVEIEAGPRVSAARLDELRMRWTRDPRRAPGRVLHRDRDARRDPVPAARHAGAASAPPSRPALRIGALGAAVVAVGGPARGGRRAAAAGRRGLPHRRRVDRARGADRAPAAVGARADPPGVVCLVAYTVDLALGGSC